jgi:hypothetical protein
MPLQWNLDKNHSGAWTLSRRRSGVKRGANSQPETPQAGCGKRNFRRRSPMRRCAASDMDWVRTNELPPWFAVARTTAPISGSSRSVRRFAMTPSIRNLVEAATRLTAISTGPIDNKPHWCRGSIYLIFPIQPLRQLRYGKALHRLNEAGGLPGACFLDRPDHRNQSSSGWGAERGARSLRFVRQRAA